MRQVARRRAGRGDPVHRDASRHRLVQPPQPSKRIAQVRGETDHTEHSVRDRGDRGNDRHADEGTRDCGRRYVGSRHRMPRTKRNAGCQWRLSTGGPTSLRVRVQEEAGTPRSPSIPATAGGQTARLPAAEPWTYRTSILLAGRCLTARPDSFRLSRALPRTRPSDQRRPDARHDALLRRQHRAGRPARCTRGRDPVSDRSRARVPGLLPSPFGRRHRLDHRLRRRAGTAESTRVAADWIRDNMPDLVASPPMVSSGTVTLSS